jgi:hypothetical protein
MAKRVIRSFVETLGLLSRGRFVEKCDAELARLIEALEASPDEKGKATVTVALELTFLAGRVDIKPTVKSKLPEEKGFPGTPFWSLDHGLSVEHPSQIDMFGPRDAGERAAKA